MRKRARDIQIAMAMLLVGNGMLPLSANPFLPGHPFESSWTFWYSYFSLIAGFWMLKRLSTAADSGQP